MKPRVAGRLMSDIPSNVLAALNAGELETGSLVEGLAIDFQVLLRSAFPAVAHRLEIDRALPYTQRLRLSAELIADQVPLDSVLTHSSDTIRGIGAYIIGRNQGLSVPEVVEAIRPLAADPHFGVREWAWLGIRPRIVAQPVEYIVAFGPWSHDLDPNIRRFGSEATRPRGVWCAHIRELREEPWLALPILEPLRADPAKYVQDSVANWLNDASKTQPQWVRETTDKWLSESYSESTKKIVKRALRTLNAQK